MKRDLLREATTALSESGHNQAGGKFTRERIVATLHEKQRRGRARRALWLPLAAIFVGSTAFAGVGGSFSAVVDSALGLVGFDSGAQARIDEKVEPSPARRSTASAAEDKSTSDKAQIAKAVEPEPAEAQAETDAPSEAGQPPRAEQATQAAPSAIVPVPDGHELYRRGHRAHFKEGDPARALQAYDAYLKQQPSGRFAVDARYNRALCLVRLGRHAEARKSLEPFANGAFGDYRKQDAQRLLDVLEP